MLLRLFFLFIFLFLSCHISWATDLENFKVNYDESFAYKRVGDSSHSGYQYGSLRRISSTKKPSYRYYLFAGAYHNLIETVDKGTGTYARWVSKENFNIEAASQYVIGKKVWLGVKASLHMQQYEEELNPFFTSEQDLDFLYKLALTSDYEGEKWGLGFDFNYNGEQFLYETNFNVELNRIFLKSLSLRLKYKLLATNMWSSRVFLNIQIPLANTNSIDAQGEGGVFGYFEVSYNKITKKNGLSCQIYYGVNEITNEQNDQTETTAGFKCGIVSFNWL